AASYSPWAFLLGRARSTTPTASWVSSSADCISLTVSISTSLSAAAITRESGTLPPDRSCHSREGAAGDHVYARGLARAFVHRSARHAEHDGWEHHHAHPYAPGSRL